MVLATMNDVQWSEIELPIGGHDEGVDKRILPPGKFVSVINGDYVKPGTIRKRPGIRRRVSSFANDFPKGDRLARWRNQIFVFDPEDSVAVHQINEINGDYPQLPPGGMPPIPTATVRATTVNNDLTRDVFADVAVTTNGFLVYGILGRPGSGGGKAGASVRVVEVSSGSVVLEEQILLGNNNAGYVRAAASGDMVLVTWSGSIVAVNNEIRGIIVDCTTEVPTLIGAGTIPKTAEVLVSDVSDGWLAHDSVGLTVTTSRWALVYRQAGTDDLKLVQVTYSGGFSFASTTVDTADVTHLSVIVAADGQDIVVSWARLLVGPAGVRIFRYAVFDEATLATVLAKTIWHSTTLTTVLATAIGKFQNGSTDDYTLFASYTRGGSVSPPDSTPITAWCQATRSGMSGTPRQKRRIYITGKPWVQGNRQHIWTATEHGVATTGGKSYTQVLISVPNYPERMYRASELPGATIETTGFPQAAAPPFIQSTGLQLCQPASYALIDGTYHTCQHVIYVPLEVRVGPVDCQVRYDHLGRYSNVEFGGSTYCTGGVVTEWDGAKLREVGTVHASILFGLVSALGGSFADTGNYSYLVVYEYIDAQTQRHRFLKSNVLTVNVANATDKVELRFEPLTLTRAQRYGAQNAEELGKVYMTIYRAREATGNLFQRLFQYSETPTALVNDPTSLNYLTYTDTGEDNVDNEVLFTESGEFQNDMPYGGATAICVHKDRLWLAGGMDPEIVWYSKPRVDGLPAEFSLAFTFRIPGEEVVALGSLEGALIVFCSRGIYAIDGDGPDVTGQGRPFDVPRKINADSACIGPRAVIEIPQGLIFQTRNGLYLIDRKQNINYIGEPIKDTMLLYPIVRGVANESRRGEVMFALNDSAGTAGTVAVYNYLQGMWSLWNHKKRDSDGILNDPTPWSDISAWLDREVVYLAQNGCLYEQQAAANVHSDDLLFYGLDVETGWISFGRLQGYKMVRKAGVLLERFGAHGLTLGLKYSYQETGGSTLVWPEVRITDIGAVEWLRVTVPRKKTPAIRLRLTETSPQALEIGQDMDTPGFAIDGFAFQIGMIPGLNRLPASQSG